MASSIIQLEPTLGLGGTSIYYQRSTIASEDMNSQIVVNHHSVFHTEIYHRVVNKMDFLYPIILGRNTGGIITYVQEE